MKLFPGFLHHFLRWNSLGAALADFPNSGHDLAVPGLLDFGRRKILDAGNKFLGQFDPPRRRPFQQLKIFLSSIFLTAA